MFPAATSGAQGRHSTHVLTGRRPNGGLMNYEDILSARSKVTPGEGARYQMNPEQSPFAGYQTSPGRSAQIDTIKSTKT